MRAVIGTVISSKPVTLKSSAATLSNFADVATTRSRPELAVFSTRASRSFAELLAFHRNLQPPHTAAAGDLHSTRNRADAGQTGAGIGIGDESPSLGTNREAGLENGARSGVERDIDVKRDKMKETGEAVIENVSAERDGKRKKMKERVEAARDGKRKKRKERVEAAVENVSSKRDRKRKKRKERVEAAVENVSSERDGKRKKRKERVEAAVENVSSERDGKRKKRKERVEAAEGNRKRKNW